jgi:hypothetical protein
MRLGEEEEEERSDNDDNDKKNKFSKAYFLRYMLIANQ